LFPVVLAELARMLGGAEFLEADKVITAGGSVVGNLLVVGLKNGTKVGSGSTTETETGRKDGVDCGAGKTETGRLDGSNCAAGAMETMSFDDIDCETDTGRSDGIDCKAGEAETGPLDGVDRGVGVNVIRSLNGIECASIDGTAVMMG
jgi:hypothetical protein